MSYTPGTLPTIVGGIVLVFVILALVTIIITWPVMWLINWLFLPSVLLALFGVAKIGFWQTWALLFICGSLFKSTYTGNNKN
jgi:hypothetical protein